MYRGGSGKRDVLHVMQNGVLHRALVEASTFSHYTVQGYDGDTSRILLWNSVAGSQARLYAIRIAC